MIILLFHIILDYDLVDALMKWKKISWRFNP